MDTKHIWKGAVGAQIKRKINGTTQQPFYTIEPKRCYKTADSEEFKYAHDFSEEQLETLINDVIPAAKAYRAAAMLADKSDSGAVIAFPERDGFDSRPVALREIIVVDGPAEDAAIS